MPIDEELTRGDLPHWYVPGHAHFVTYRLGNSIPPSRLRLWRERRDAVLEGRSADFETRVSAHKKFFAAYDSFLDRHPNERWLAEPAIAEVIRENLYHHHGSLYELIAWCVMPNHVHVVLQPFHTVADAASVRELAAEDPKSSSQILVADAGSVRHGDVIHSDEVPDSHSPLSRIMHSLKSYTANQANRLLGREGRFWQRESYDHWIRDLAELQRIIDYVRFNPVKARHCSQPHEWGFSSAFDRYQQDRSLSGLVGWLRDDWLR